MTSQGYEATPVRCSSFHPALMALSKGKGKETDDDAAKHAAAVMIQRLWRGAHNSAKTEYLDPASRWDDAATNAKFAVSRHTVIYFLHILPRSIPALPYRKLHLDRQERSHSRKEHSQTAMAACRLFYIPDERSECHVEWGGRAGRGRG